MSSSFTTSPVDVEISGTSKKILDTGVKNLLINYNEIDKKRTEIDFDIDGIVYKINNYIYQLIEPTQNYKSIWNVLYRVVE